MEGLGDLDMKLVYFNNTLAFDIDQHGNAIHKYILLGTTNMFCNTLIWKPF